MQVLESNNIIVQSIDDVYNFHDNGFKQLFRIPNDKYLCLNISEHGVDNAYDASIFYQKMLSNLSQSDYCLI
jgi:hypothetical protein